MRMPILLRLCFSLVLLAPALVCAATLENPATGSFYSGIGVISGWKCTANGPLTVRFNDGAPLPLAYGNVRADVRNAGACPSAQVGFVSIMNWAELGDGEHTAVVYDNGVEFAQATFTVGTTGEEFVEDVTLSIEVPNFPAPGERGVFVWNESTQHLELVRVMPTARTPPPPQAGSSYLYWTGNGRIQRARLDGTQVTSLLIGEHGPDFYS